MRRALFFTAYNRPEYLAQTLASWKEVRGFYSWHVYVMVEPSNVQKQIIELFEELEHPNMFITVNPRLYGVLHSPWVGFQRLFANYNFVVRAEDDLLVSTDILEYFTWASEEYYEDPQIGSVIAFTHDDGHPSEVKRDPSFSPWIWGTWSDRWNGFMSETWDHNYSTFNGSPGNQAGWDWNLNTRIFPERGLSSIYPLASRVQNIGMFGTHAVPSEFETTDSYVKYREHCSFRETKATDG